MKPLFVVFVRIDMNRIYFLSYGSFYCIEPT